MRMCPHCGTAIQVGDKFCANCGAVVAGRPEAAGRIPSTASVATRAFTRKAKILYTLLALSCVAIFTYVFITHLPGKAHPVIEHQPEIAMPSTFIGTQLSAHPIEIQRRNGKVIFPLSLLLEKRMIQFDYQTASTSLPILAFVSPEGKLVTAIRICEPCNSHSFLIDGDQMVCGTCGTRWKLSNLEGVQGSCQKYPPDPIPSEIVGNEVQIDEQVLRNWKMRI